MASRQTRSGVGGLPPPKGWVFTRAGISGAMASHESSGMLHGSAARCRPIESPPAPTATARPSSAAAPRSYTPCQVIRIGSKGRLRLAGERGTPSEYETILAEEGRRARAERLAQLVDNLGAANVGRDLTVALAVLKRGIPLLVDAGLEDDGLSLHFDGLKRVDGPSRLGSHHYLPVLHPVGVRDERLQKVLLAVYGLALARVQGLRPAIGPVVRDVTARLRTVRLEARVYRQAESILSELRRLREGHEPPRLSLNGHCPLCEFRPRCRAHAEQADDISLLGGVGEKELQKLHRKGVFTLTQLSCTFRPRKKSKRVKRPGNVRYRALQALALRGKKIHVYGTPCIPREPVEAFFDAEGNEDGGLAYLLGVIVVERDAQTRQAFWADSPDREAAAFDAFLDLLARHEHFTLFHYGGYEKALRRRMRRVVRRKKLVDRALASAVNVLSVIHARVYFPTFTNGLKEVGGYLGCTWTQENSSGLLSLVWRTRREQTGDPVWEERLVTYNAEDCAALRAVTECVRAIGEAALARGGGAAHAPPTPPVAWADEPAAPATRREWCRARFAVEDFDYVNRCAWFDYQREKVFLRTSKAVRHACQRHPTRRKRAKPPANKQTAIRSAKRPFCKGTRIERLTKSTHAKLAYDLKFTAGGVRRQVIRCVAALHRCEACGRTFLPKKYKRLDIHLHGLKSWAMYQHVVHRVSLQHLERMFEDCFGLRVCLRQLHRITSLLARRYRPTCRRILDRIACADLIHADETHVNLQTGKGYVWVFTNLADVVHAYRPSREAGFLQDLLREFKGVPVSDFYSGYDSLPCRQQKCLVHLIRDFNGDLSANPFAEEFKTLAGEFGKLLRPIVATIDRYGLKNHFLHKHKAEVARFGRALESRAYRSERAESYRGRLLKSWGKLFTFLGHDGVPWNNNNAEHAVKAFAYYRRIADGKMREEGLSDYLALLSLYQTCKYRGCSFLKFLLAGEEDVAAFCQRGRIKQRPARLEVYPKGFPRPYRRNGARNEGRNRETESGT
jgi:predicted RecB family nuclease